MLAFLQIGILATAVAAVTVSFDTGYDDGSRSLDRVACSNGNHGLETRYHWTTQGQIPRFPYIGGAQAIGGWNSENCGTCWSLSYEGRTVTVLAVDHDDVGFNIAKRALDELTGGRAVEVGRIDAAATQVDVKQCGLSG